MEYIKTIGLLILCLFFTTTVAAKIPSNERSTKAIASIELPLKKELTDKGLKYGAPLFVRIFKDPGVLELWLENGSGEFKLFKRYDICAFSGNLGPKLKQGDQQSPEGFYFVNPGQLNPWSQFYLSFNLGYPNKYDRHHGRTGSALMVHGNCVSIGCYAMTDPVIKEVFAIAVAAFEKGQPFFRVHVFPFALEQNKLAKYQSHKWYSFWENLQEGYAYFQRHKRPPNVDVHKGKYIFEAQ